MSWNGAIVVRSDLLSTVTLGHHGGRKDLDRLRERPVSLRHVATVLLLPTSSLLVNHYCKSRTGLLEPCTMTSVQSVYRRNWIYHVDHNKLTMRPLLLHRRFTIATANDAFIDSSDKPDGGAFLQINRRVSALNNPIHKSTFCNELHPTLTRVWKFSAFLITLLHERRLRCADGFSPVELPCS